MLERMIARVARDPDTVRKVAERFYAFAQLRAKTEHKYRRTVDRLIEELGNIPIGQVTSRMLRDSVHCGLARSRGSRSVGRNSLRLRPLVFGPSMDGWPRTIARMR